MTSPDNPYQSPVAEPLDIPVASPVGVAPLNAKRMGWIFAKWLLVCYVSAAPSFFWGSVISEFNLVNVLAMILGIFVFVIGYTLVEFTSFVRKSLLFSPLRLTFRIGYWTRIGVSILFPVGIYLDLFVGFLSVGISDSFFSTTIASGNSPDAVGASFFAFFFTTLIQGVFLNLLLFGYMVIVFGIIVGVRSLKASR